MPAIHDWTLAATGLGPWLLEESYAVVGDGAETAALVLDQVRWRVRRCVAGGVGKGAFFRCAN